MKIKISLILNIIIFILALIGTAFMLVGFQFMGAEDTLSATKLEMFRFYTVDSNILMGIVAAVFAIFETQLLKGKIKEIPARIYILKLIGTVGVTLTFLTVVFYLGPIAENGFFSMFMNTNLFFHLIIPVLSIVTFIFFENTDSIEFRYTFLGTLTMIIYAIYYAVNVLIHTENGKVSPVYDWYWFVQNGVWTMVIVIPVMLILTYAISFTLWKLNRKLK